MVTNYHASFIYFVKFFHSVAASEKYILFTSITTCFIEIQNETFNKQPLPWNMQSQPLPWNMQSTGHCSILLLHILQCGSHY